MGHIILRPEADKASVDERDAPLDPVVFEGGRRADDVHQAGRVASKHKGCRRVDAQSV